MLQYGAVDASLPVELRRDDVQAAILRALRRAYEENQNRHHPGVGDDALTFGIHLWKSGAYFLVAELAELPGVQAQVVNQSLDLRVERCRLRLHKLGDSEEDDPEHSFPNHVGPATRLGRAEQLRLDLDLHGGCEYLDWVVGHYGSPDEGLRALRLHAVGSERALDGTIARWEAVETLFDAAGMDAPPGKHDPRPETVVAPEPTINPRTHLPAQGQAKPA